jgi:hypothetical protein
MKRITVLLLALSASTAFAQTSPFDGEWRGRSDGGSCNTPLDFALSIEAGIVDGTATDPAAHGPVPNLKKTAPPPPVPGLWQIYGVATPGTFTLRALASVQGSTHRETRFSSSVRAGSLTLSESGGCGRKASLSRTVR